MSNKYLGKIASWKNPSKFLGYVTGARKTEAASKMKHIEQFLANKETLEGVKDYASREAKETAKARLATAAGTGALVGGAAYGYHKLRQRQERETIKRYNDLFKEASTGSAAKELSHSAITGVGHLLRRLGKTTVDVMNTAGGGKIKDQAVLHGMKYGGKEYKQFVSSGPREQVKQILKKNPSVNRHRLIHEIGNLHRGKRNARIALGSTAIAGVSGYGLHKTRQALKKQEKGYYS